MKYVDFKGNKISKLSLGTVQFGIDYGISNKAGKPNQNKVNRIIQFLQNEGVNSFDTAKGYGDSEKVLGNYFVDIDNSNNFIVSKFDSNELELNEDKFLAFIEESLLDLKVETLFGLLMHNSDLTDRWNSNFSQKVKLLKYNNMIKYFGVSIYSTDEFELALNNDDIDIIQIPFNIIDQRAKYKGWLEKAKVNNKLLFIRSVYLQGLLLMEIDDIPEKLEDAKQYIIYIDELAKNLNISRNELCLSFVNTVASEASVLFGCDTLDQAKENISTFNNMEDLDKETIEKLSTKFVNIDEKIYNPTKW